MKGSTPSETCKSRLWTLPTEMFYFIIRYLDYVSLLNFFKAEPETLVKVFRPQELRKILAKIPFTRALGSQVVHSLTGSSGHTRFIPPPKEIERRVACQKRENQSRVWEVLSTLEDLSGMDPLDIGEARSAVKYGLAHRIMKVFSVGSADSCPICLKKSDIGGIEVTFGSYWPLPGTSTKAYLTGVTDIEGWELLRSIELEMEFLGCGYREVGTTTIGDQLCPCWLPKYLRGSELASFRRHTQAPPTRPRKIVATVLRCYTIREVLTLLSMMEEEDVYDIDISRAYFHPSDWDLPYPISLVTNMNRIWAHQIDPLKKREGKRTVCKTVYSLTDDLKWTSQINPKNVLKGRRRHLVVLSYEQSQDASTPPE